MRTTVTIPDEKMDELLAITEAHSKTQAVNEAIEAFIRRHRLQQLRAFKGKVEVLSNDEIEALEIADLAALDK
jgi:metal-responsive CopG/Arc/MetJ family transcriptional regulator